MQDIGWSYDSSILVSVGLDSKVVVWSGHTFEKLKTLANHQSHVKGITFDPANKYFATASDDRTIKIFRFTSPPPNATAQDQANNFTIESTITTPFQTSPLTTYFRRCSWSPDGAHISAANATNGPVSSVAIIGRGTWDSDINLIGHEGPVEVCAFSPRLFYAVPPQPEHLDASGQPLLPSVTVVACAGQDKTISVWNTSYARPFVITQEIANKAITDLAWTPDGETLFFTSVDGGIMAAVFERGELGYPASIQQNEKALSKFGAGRKAGIVESADALLLEEHSKAGELRGVQGRMGELMGDGGKAEAATTNGTVTPQTNGTTAATINGAATETTEKEKSAAPSVPAPDPKVERLKSRVEIVNGKKRIKPILVSSASGIAESSLPQTQLVSAATQGTRSDAPHSILDLSKPYDGFPKGGLATLLVGNKRKFAEIEGDEEKRIEKRISAAVTNGSAPIVINGVDGLIPPSAAARPDSEVPGPLRPAIVNPSLVVSQVRLATPMMRSVIMRSADGSDAEKPSDETVVLEARNASGATRTGRSQDRDPTRINCTRRGQSLWQDYLPKPVLLLTGNGNFWTAACEDGSVYVWTPAGRRLLNAMVLEAQPVILDCRGWWLMCISAVGLCHVWNIKTMASPHPPVSVAPILDIAAYSQGPHLTHSPGIVFARMNSAGKLIVAMSNGDGYTYSSNMCIWQRLSEAWWAVGSQYWNTTDSSLGNLQSTNDQAKKAEQDDQVSVENLSAGIIPILERNTTNHILLRGRAFYLQKLIKALLSAEGFEGFESSVSIAHLENRVAAALALGAREEYKIYLMMYAKRLGAEGLKGKVEELLRSLMGDVFAYAESDESDRDPSLSEDICGWKREELLKEVVLILGKYRSPKHAMISVCDLRPLD